MAESWEPRMAARAQDREAAGHVVEQAEADRDYRARFTELERLGMSYRAGMTLGEAMALLRAEPWACACVGPPHCCRYSFIQARAQHRAAHIVAKLLLTRAERGTDVPQ